MNIYTAVLCDSAEDLQGKLNVTGAFDTLFAERFPVAHKECSLALRFGYTQKDAGTHKISLNIVDDQGKSILPEETPIQGEISVEIPEGLDFFTRNSIIRLQNMIFQKEGTYTVDITMNDAPLVAIPFRVVLVKKIEAEAAATEDQAPAVEDNTEAEEKTEKPATRRRSSSK